MTVAWVIGARGMLGSALCRAITARTGWEQADIDPFDWSSGSVQLREEAREASRELVSAALETGQSASIVWAAGAGVTSSSQAAFDAEYDQLEAILAGIVEGCSGAPVPLTIFYASSAGGVYAGSARPPFTESTPARALAPYGVFKLKAEAAVRAAAVAAGAPSLVGRIANLYGPGQRLDKLQGLISHIALARLTARPASIYVPLDTLRDYILVDSCAALILDSLERLEVEGGQVTKIMGSGQATSIATLLGQFRAITRGRPRVILGSSAASAFQSRDLRLRSEVWTDLDKRRTDSLPAGIHATVTDILSTIQRGKSY